MNRTRKIRKQFWLTEEEAHNLKQKAMTADITETAVIRILLKGHELREKPDERFYAIMRELSAIGNNIHQLSTKANALGFIDAPMLRQEAEKWARFQADVEAEILRPTKSSLKWE